MYQDINGNQFESYAQAVQYYGGENDAVLDGEAEQADEEYNQYLATYHGAHACELYYRNAISNTIPF